MLPYTLARTCGMFLAELTIMDAFIYACERCRESFAGHPYRVISEADGERLLDMMVCYGCYLEASRLGLETEKIQLRELVFH